MRRTACLLTFLVVGCQSKPAVENTAERPAAVPTIEATPAVVIAPPKLSGSGPSPSLTADQLKIACARIAAETDAGGEPAALELDDFATEGASAEVFREDGKVVRIRGGKLFEAQRFAFDYFFRDGRLLCADETTSNVLVIAEENEGWDYWWHRQFVAFDGSKTASRSVDATANGADRGTSPEELQREAMDLLKRAASP